MSAGEQCREGDGHPKGELGGHRWTGEVQSLIEALDARLSTAGASYRVEHAVQSDPESPFVWQPMPYAVILEHDTRAAAERELNEHIACGRDPNRLRVREVA